MIANGPQYSLLGRPGLGERFGLHTVLAFFSNRVLRGGPKILLNLATCLVALIIITKLLPSRMTDITFGPTYGSIWHGGDSKDEKATNGKDEVGGGLRMVVFGESDIATPALTGGEEEGTILSWTEMLCAELGCSKHLSFVPRTDPLESPMTSNSFYAAAVERVLNETAESTMPALDYTFVPDLFPIKWDIPDLATQVSNFLSMEKPEKPPTETIYVLSLGPWDIWSLAMLPISVGKSITDTITIDIFTHVERLYAASRDEKSIAYSNYFDEATLAALANGTSVNNTDAAIQTRGEYPNVRSDVEPFRIIIPKVFDPSALPGWWDSRPPVASIHSKAEQMKHAAELTEHWNNNLHNGLAQWILTGTQEMEKEKEEKAKEEKGDEKPKKSESEKEPIEEKRRRSPTTSAPESGMSAAAAAPKKSRHALRDGIAYDMPDYVLAVMADRQMRNSDLQDSNGMGESPAEDSFLEVWTPCIQPAHPVPVQRVNPSDITINIKHDKPKMDKALSQEDESKKADGGDKKSEDKKEEKKEEEKKDENKQEASSGKKQRRAAVPATAKDDGEGGSAAETKALQSQSSAVGRVCPEPNDHLFYTSFALSQRAIEYIAKEVADMVRFNETVRRQWSREDARARNDGNEHH